MNTADVYVITDEDSHALYVGCSITPAIRLASHKRKPWGAQIVNMTILGTFPRDLAEQIEHDVIGAIQPPQNIASRNGLRAVEMARASKTSAS